MKVKNPVSQSIRIFPKINQKKYLQNRKVQVLYVNLCTQCLVGAPLAQMTASVRCGMEVSNSPVLFLLSPGKMLLTLFLFQKWLGSPFPEDV